MRVLVVDDDPIYRETSRMFLSMQGRDVTLAENGTAGLRKLTEGVFDILIVDMEMPDMSGLEVISRVRSRPETVDLPIIMVTSRDDAMAIDRLTSSGLVLRGEAGQLDADRPLPALRLPCLRNEMLAGRPRSRRNSSARPRITS